MAAVRCLYGVHRKRADRVGELTFVQCHMSPGKGCEDDRIRGGQPFAGAGPRVNRLRHTFTSMSARRGYCPPPPALLTLGLRTPPRRIPLAHPPPSTSFSPPRTDRARPGQPHTSARSGVVEE